MTNGGPEFVLRRMSDTSDVSLLREIRRVDALVNLPTLTRTEFQKHAKVHSSTISKRFGTWQAALECAGIAAKFEGRTLSEGSGVGRRNTDDEEILNELRQLAERLGRNVLTSDEIRSELGMSTQLLINRFGSTGKALASAGLKQSKRGLRYTDDERFENVLKVWTALGRQPMYRDMQRAPSQVGGKAYVLRYGSWLKALEAFVERVNVDGGDAPSTAEATVLEHEAKPRTDCLDSFQSSEDRRDIRLGQRFRVLKRDNFKCVLCGNTPATDPTCTLHVDHVLPFSRGGKTVDTNLRSLCAPCNVGRGDRYYD